MRKLGQLLTNWYYKFLLFLAKKLYKSPDFEPKIRGYNLLHVLLLPIARLMLQRSQESTASARLITPKIPKDVEIDGIIVPVYIDQAFRMHDVGEVFESIRAWERAVPGLVIQPQIREISWRYLLNLHWASIPTVIDARRGIKNSLINSVNLYMNFEKGTRGLTFPRAMATVVIDAFPSVKQTTTHELGHILGSMRHSKDEDSVMYGPGVSLKITEEDAEVVRKKFCLKKRK